MQIGNFDTSKKVFIIAELSANHAGSLKTAKDTVYAAKESGADAIKLQTYTPEWMTLKIDRDEFKAGDLWKDEYLYDLYQKAMTPLEWHKELFDYARSLELEVFSSPFSKEAVDFLEQFEPPAYKIASFEITDYDLIDYAASKGRPMIISTGVATLQEIQDVADICKKRGVELALLKCTSAYPTPRSEVNLKTIPAIKEIFNVEVGFSDHTLGISAPVAAAAMGARIIEKHFILDKNLNSPDKDFSLTPDEFKEMVMAVRETEEMMGEVNFKPKSGRQFARSLYVVKDIEKGETFSEENIKSIRPGYGLHPKYLPEILGKKACKDLKKGDRLRWEDITD
ncbi:N-acetylneuraminic acid synthetase [Nautilia profundicola AmH]|uniref:N-acetylneuraminic acid synthetase n=1 Tax=Nautilia profundicola (strain ATCC BAA-1463 / DSM 18972 / AmH) TaxID=598659 RepID=B9L6J4_NAUPA|nr:pseudaminic acid synthase [Nautilia profundicola]ACM93350.1 N-acetylneuraminic acid synthetase [Nautilia profundicola AmH]